MRKIYSIPAFLLLCLAGYSQGEIKLGPQTAFVFATLETGKRILTARDEFIMRLSPFDRAARMKTDKEVSEKDFLEFLGRNVLSWSEGEKQKTASALQDITSRLERFSHRFPPSIYLIMTTGSEEGGAAYTRDSAIVIPRAEIEGSPAMLQRMLCHEFFHILTRNDPALREQLYNTIGFTRCQEIEFPQNLKSRKITNPDAPRNDYGIFIKKEGKMYWAVPILFSSRETYDVKLGGEFFNYLQFQFLLAERHDAQPGETPVFDAGKPQLADPQQISGFFEQVGRNTSYLLHPDEILADNFALLVLGKKDVASREILEKMEKVLSEKKIGPNPGSEKNIN